MILLDTHALVWLASGSRRGRVLELSRAALCISPAGLLELQILLEAGRVRLHAGSSIAAIEGDGRWRLDDPPAAAWFAEARAVSWTRDPFDRLLVAHAALRRWRLATADDAILQRLRPDQAFEI